MNKREMEVGLLTKKEKMKAKEGNGSMIERSKKAKRKG